MPIERVGQYGDRPLSTKVNELIDALNALAPGDPVTWTNLANKPATFPPTIGTTATTAKIGTYVPTSAEVSTALKAKTQVAALTTVGVADATDATTAAALANASKVAINAIIAALKA